MLCMNSGLCERYLVHIVCFLIYFKVHALLDLQSISVLNPQISPDKMSNAAIHILNRLLLHCNIKSAHRLHQGLRKTTGQ